MKRLIFFVGVYDILDIFSYALIEYYNSVGYEILIIDNKKLSEGLSELSGFIKKPVTAMITFNNLGIGTELIPGQNLWESLNIPCVNILMDHPYAHDAALSSSPSNCIVLCVDRNHVRYLDRFFPNIPVCGFLPHGGIYALSDPGRDIYPKLCDRSIEIMYMGSLSRKFADADKPDFSAFNELDLEKYADIVYERMISQPAFTMEQIIEETLLSDGITLPDDRLRQVIRALHYIDMYASSYYRELFVKTLVNAGLPVTIYGRGWDICDWLGKSNVDFRGAVNAYDAVKLMRNAKIVLNSMPWFRDGSHDRVFNAMLSGAVAVSEESIYMREAVPKNCGVLFSLDEMGAMPDKIKSLAADEKTAQALADCGFSHAKSMHTWGCRGQWLDDTILSELE